MQVDHSTKTATPSRGIDQLACTEFTKTDTAGKCRAVTWPKVLALIPTGNSETALTTPSGQQTGLKLNVDIDVAADKLADFVIDFNVCKSIVAAGASGKYLLKPVLAVTPHYVSGVKGTVDLSIATGANATILLEQAGKLVKATTPDSTGNFLLQPVAAGTYDLVVTSSGHVTSVVTGVVVTTDTVTTVGTPIKPPGSVLANGTLSGTVTPADAMLAVTQTVGSGATARTIEVTGGPANATTGAYAYVAPVDALSVAPYAAGTLTFAADLANAGKYTVSATSGTVTKSSPVLTVGAGATVGTTFTFP